MITTDRPEHGPEIDYLIDGENGLCTADDLGAYVDGVVRALTDPGLLDRLNVGCRQSAAGLTLQAQVEGFADGIGRCLAAPPRRFARRRRKV